MIVEAPSHRGFTLLEVMLALIIGSVAMIALGTLFVGSHRLMRQSYGVSLASLALRAEREHLLFHSVHEGGNVFWGGLLSATAVAAYGDAGVRYTPAGIELGEFRNGGPMWSKSRLGDRTNQLYPDPDRDLPEGRSVESVRWSNRGDSVFAVTLRQEVAHTGVEMSDRVVVPVFGTKQSNAAALFVGEEW